MTLHISYSMVLFILVLIACIVYIAFYIFLSSVVKKEERALLDIYLHKISKIPALIEVMRPYIIKPEAFDALTHAHTKSIIESHNSIYDILSDNATLQNEFLFLMKLSQHAPELQKHEYFLYIRDFIIRYEREMRDRFTAMNDAIRAWNSFIQIKNFTLI